MQNGSTNNFERAIPILLSCQSSAFWLSQNKKLEVAPWQHSASNSPPLQLYLSIIYKQPYVDHNRWIHSLFLKKKNNETIFKQCGHPIPNITNHQPTTRLHQQPTNNTHQLTNKPVEICWPTRQPEGGIGMLASKKSTRSMRALNTSKGPGLQPPKTSLVSDQMAGLLGGGGYAGGLTSVWGFSKPGWSCWFLVLTSRNHRVFLGDWGGFLKKVLLMVVPYTKCYVHPKIRCYMTYILLTVHTFGSKSGW